jgi:2-methylcitrate dehydratase
MKFEWKVSMQNDLQNVQIARFALSAKYTDVGLANIDQLKKHLLDAIGSLLHATTKPAPRKMMRQLTFLSDGGPCKVPLLEGLPFDRAAQWYTALIRYPDFMDNFLGKEATCHPSDNLGPLLAAAQLHNCTGFDFLTAMAIAYEIECRLVEEIPVMMEGIDHTLMLAYSITAPLARMYRLTEEQTAHALGIAGTSISPMVTSRASYTYEWKGFASSLEAFNCTNIVLLAREGMTGPVALFEGPKGFKEVFEMKLDFDWASDRFELIKKCVLKRYNAEVHTQPTIQAALELKEHHNIEAADIEKVDITTFLTAYHITGSGAYGDRQKVETKEQADHSLFYVVAVALLDGDVFPEQFEAERINRQDVQELMRKINIHTKSPIHKPMKLAGMLDPYTEAYPDKVMTNVDITLKNRHKYSCEKSDYPGFFTDPFSWPDVIEKFKRLTNNVIQVERQDSIVAIIQKLEEYTIDKLIALIT